MNIKYTIAPLFIGCYLVFSIKSCERSGKMANARERDAMFICNKLFPNLSTVLVTSS